MIHLKFLIWNVSLASKSKKIFLDLDSLQEFLKSFFDNFRMHYP
jgi:hypothetical protein